MVAIDRAHPDPSLERRLHDLYAASIPATIAAGMDRRIDSALDAGARHVATTGPFRRRTMGALVVAVVLVAAGAMPVLRLFEDWGRPYDRVFALSTLVEQVVTHDGYRVGLVRAYADAVSVQLAMTVEDLGARGWAEVHVGAISVSDDGGRTYPQEQMAAEQPQSHPAENWIRFRTPASAAGRPDHQLRVEVTGLAARAAVAPTLYDGAVDLERVWTTISGRWAFEFDLPFHAPQTARPKVTTIVDGIAVVLEELSVTPAMTVGRLSVTGLPAVHDPAWGWDPHLRVVRNDRALTVLSLAPGFVSNQLEFEADPGFDDLSGTWVVTIEQFHRNVPDPDSDVTSEEEILTGPWVVEYTR